MLGLVTVVSVDWTKVSKFDRDASRFSRRFGSAVRESFSSSHAKASIVAFRPADDPLVYHFKGSKVPSRFRLQSKHCRLAWNVRFGPMAGHGPPHSIRRRERVTSAMLFVRN